MRLTFLGVVTLIGIPFLLLLSLFWMGEIGEFFLYDVIGMENEISAVAEWFCGLAFSFILAPIILGVLKLVLILLTGIMMLVSR